MSRAPLVARAKVVSNTFPEVPVARRARGPHPTVTPSIYATSSALRHPVDEAEMLPPPSLACRKWIKAPRSPMSTAATRREWFRALQYNIMTDSFTTHLPSRPAPGPRALLCDAQMAALQDQSRRDHVRESDGSVDEVGYTTFPMTLGIDFSRLPGAAAGSPAPCLLWSDRMTRLMHEVQFLDADVVTFNEVNKVHFNHSLWRAMRSLGYGAMYVSSRRTSSVSYAFRHGASVHPKDHVGKLPYEQDVGTAIFYHKGRYFPVYQAGPEFPVNVPHAHFCGLRDKVSNITLLVGAIHLHDGESKEAVTTRSDEIGAMLKVLDWSVKNSSDRAGLGVLLCGEFNNVRDDEPCVAMLRHRYESLGDIAAGPRWTTWRNVLQNNVPAAVGSVANGGKREEDGGASASAEETGAGPDVIPTTTKAITSHLDNPRVVRRTTNYMFVDPQNLSALQFLDVPPDSAVSEVELLPNHVFPSHQIPLVADLCWNTFAPEEDDLLPRE